MGERRTCPANSSGHILHRWWDNTGQEWACAAYDHSAFCRLCRPVDAATHHLLENVERGHMEVWTEASGELSFKLTEAGQQAARRLVETDPEMRALWDRMVTNDMDKRLGDGPAGGE